jgi:branched-chain amino acid transport system substrate-binding protein
VPRISPFLAAAKKARTTRFVRGLKDELGGKASSMIVAEASQDYRVPLVKDQIERLRSANADVFLNFLGAAHAIEAPSTAAQMGWTAQQIVSAASADAIGNMNPTVEVITARPFKNNSSQWQNDADYKTWSEFMGKYLPGADKKDSNTVYGYAVAQTLVHVLDKCGDNLTRENVMAQAANLRDLQLGMMLPGVTLSTSKSDFAPIKQAQMMKLTGGTWVAFGPDYSGEDCKAPKKQCGSKCCD